MNDESPLSVRARVCVPRLSVLHFNVACKKPIATIVLYGNYLSVDYDRDAPLSHFIDERSLLLLLLLLTTLPTLTPGFALQQP